VSEAKEGWKKKESGSKEKGKMQGKSAYFVHAVAPIDGGGGKSRRMERKD